MNAYTRLSGAGNDFLALVEPSRTPASGEIRAWCRRGLSLGADGLFILTRTEGGARMVHFNADGGRGELCLNGSRCAARLALDLGWGRDGGLLLETDIGVLASREVDRGIEVELPPIVGEPEDVTLTVDSRRYEGWMVRVGVPHFVLPWQSSLAGAPVRELGPELRSHPDLGPEGANVDFVRFVSAGRVEIRTFERGVEDETLACGTGVVAVAAAGVAAGRLELPVVALTAGGYELRVDGKAEGGLLRSATLAGDARALARGELLPAAGTVPSAAAWS